MEAKIKDGEQKLAFVQKQLAAAQAKNEAEAKIAGNRGLMEASAVAGAVVKQLEPRLSSTATTATITTAISDLKKDLKKEIKSLRVEPQATTAGAHACRRSRASCLLVQGPRTKPQLQPCGNSSDHSKQSDS
jgi:hypothetical protein